MVQFLLPYFHKFILNKNIIYDRIFKFSGELSVISQIKIYIHIFEYKYFPAKFHSREIKYSTSHFVIAFDRSPHVPTPPECASPAPAPAPRARMMEDAKERSGMVGGQLYTLSITTFYVFTSLRLISAQTVISGKTFFPNRTARNKKKLKENENMPTPLIKCLLTRGKEKQSNKMEKEMGKWFWNIKDIRQDKTFGFGCGNHGQRDHARADQARLNIYQQNTKKRKIACQVWYFENAIITQTFFFHFHEKQEKTIHLQHISTKCRNKALYTSFLNIFHK